MRSVLAMDYPRDRLELIAVNDGSTDGSGKLIRQVKKENPSREIDIIDQPNLGKARALNNALKIAKGEFFACLDADSFVDMHALKRMVAKYQEFGDDLVILTPSMKVKSPKNLLQKFQRVEYINSVFIQRLMGYIDCIYVAPGPFSLYRKEVIQGLGGFEEQNLTEDQEIAYRVQSKHYKIRQCHDAYVYTEAPATVKELYNQRNRWFKGSLYNAFKYRKMLMNKEYGDFGVFQMPYNILNYVLAMFALFLVWTLTIWPALRHLYNFYLVRFDIWPYLKDLDFSFNLLEMDLRMMYLAYAVLAIAIFIFIVSHKFANERVREYGVVYLIPYFLGYYVLISAITAIVFFELIFGKRQKW
jgi:cellulose synthase/poly-beta-1,6-N-acetylglucosamine synthase-like glycosyltransferase